MSNLFWSLNCAQRSRFLPKWYFYSVIKLELHVHVDTWYIKHWRWINLKIFNVSGWWQFCVKLFIIVIFDNFVCCIQTIKFLLIWTSLWNCRFLSYRWNPVWSPTQSAGGGSVPCSPGGGQSSGRKDRVRRKGQSLLVYVLSCWTVFFGFPLTLVLSKLYRMSQERCLSLSWY